MSYIWKPHHYLLLAIGCLAIATLLRAPAIAWGHTEYDPNHSSPTTLPLEQSSDASDPFFATEMPTPIATPTPTATATPADEFPERVTATPTPINIWTPEVATPTLVIPTATPTATFVPTSAARRPLFIPLLINGGDPILRNGNFEQGNIYWSEYSSLRYILIVDQPILKTVSPHEGAWAAWLGGKENETAELTQRVIVPPQTPILHYWYRILADPDCGLDIASILISEQLFEQIHLCKIGNTDWLPRSIDLSQYSGQIVTLKFRVDTDRNGRYSSLYVDDVSWVDAIEP